MKAISTALCTLFLSQLYRNALAVSNSTEERRAANTCGDPSVAEIFVQAFSPSKTAQVTRVRWVFIATDTIGDDFAIQAEVFRAWETTQTGTVPLYQLSNPSGTDFIYLPSLNGAIPSAAGFIPLFVVSQPSFTDHWYTTSPTERNSLIASGWVDGGVVAFVLPVNDCTCSS
ncbi:hypothetical protein GALMADRAFT_145620 [Galerina marginata CBS 339.88]|uniref:DUF5648 domain-containing protein n=1 Tax=Galerina marginata (strain CBS 339.88) TaxID=685588 RepID=A0A067SE86_GALM3|nr:hypothetical protein GALMADRAFT_145620 [Galerina marginata CBS 339.88]